VERRSQELLISQKAGIIHPSPKPAKRFIVEFCFYCDESYDPPKTKAPKGAPPLEPTCFVVGGFMGDQPTWKKVEKRWARKNKTEKVARYHAAHLNAGTWEYDGWGKLKRLKYSKEMLGILKDQKRRLHGLSCGMHVDTYRRIINADGQAKMGHPYTVCFKTLVATLATHMEFGGFAPDDTFSVVVDQGDYALDAVAAFYGMKNDPGFAYRHRLETCTPGSSERFIGLQAADFVAYEIFRLMQGKRNGVTEMRQALNTMLATTGFHAHLIGEQYLTENKLKIEAATCRPGGLVIQPTYDHPPLPPRTLPNC
jgi:hypothetical protein